MVDIKKREIGAPRMSWEDPVPPPAASGPNGFWLVFDKIVEPGEQADISVTPEIYMKLHRLSVAPEIAPLFRVISMKMANCAFGIGGSDGSDGASGTLFPPIPNHLTPAERAEYQDLLAIDYPKLTPSNSVRLTVKNISPKRQRFNAVFWGAYWPDAP